MARSVVLQEKPYKGHVNSGCNAVMSFTFRIFELSPKRIRKGSFFFPKRNYFSSKRNKWCFLKLAFTEKFHVGCPQSSSHPGGARITLPGLCWPEPPLQHTQTKLVQNKTKPSINSYPIQTTGLKVVSLLCIPLLLARLTNEIRNP